MNNNKNINSFFLNLTKTMCFVLEDIKTNSTDISNVFDKSKTTTLKSIHYRKIYQFYQATIYAFNLEQELKFEDILRINEIIEYKINVYNGEISPVERCVSSFDKNKPVEIPIPNPIWIKQNFKNFIYTLKNTNNIKKRIDLILDFFIEEITDQWFVDGNKRTAFIVCNKLLYDYCNIKNSYFLVDLQPQEFLYGLSFFYLEKYQQNFPKEIDWKLKYKTWKKQLIAYLSKQIKKDKNQYRINKKEFKKLKENSDFWFSLREDEIEDLVGQIVWAK